MKARAKISWKNVLVGILLFALVATCLGMALGLAKVNDRLPTKYIDAKDYSIGTLDEDGKFDGDDKAALATKDLITVDGIKVKIADDADITYRLVFFDGDKEFISATIDLDADFDPDDVPDGAKYFKVVITSDEDINLAAKIKLAEQLTVSVDNSAK
jgi:hypothetical protein